MKLNLRLLKELMALRQDTCFKLVISPKHSPVSLHKCLLGGVKKNPNNICFNLLPALVPSLTYVAFLSKISLKINMTFGHRFVVNM